jgi:hypothetical protein
VGVHDIYEGQARFLQLQFLAFSSDGLTLRRARDQGMLNGVYGNAFRAFLRLSESSEPEELDDPLIGLFLVICDMSINPTAGFPAAIQDYENFLLDADPGVRFMVLCKCIATDASHLRHHVVQYSGAEYREIVQTLSNLTGLTNHLSDLSQLDKHAGEHSETLGLMDEHRTFKFSRENILLRVLTGEFFAFVTDRLKHPEFFCWTGYYLTIAGGPLTRQLWLRHLSLFSDKADDGALFVRLLSNRGKEDVLDTFNWFYASLLLYDMTKQWVLDQGPFRLEYSWLTSSSNDPDFLERIKGNFRQHYGAEIDQFILVDRPPIPPR